MKNMINKKHIYQYLLLPLLACLMAGTAGCSSDTSEGDDGNISQDGGTYMTVITRGIATALSDDGSNYDDYVKTLRIIVFDESGNMLLNKRWGTDPKLPDPIGEGDDAYIEITESIGKGGGKYSFYFIANEEEYRTMETNNPYLTDQISGTVTKDNLASIKIGFNNSAVNGTESKRPILMTAVVSDVIISAGKVNKVGIVELIRTLAKIQLKVKNLSDQSIAISNVKITDQIPYSFSLLENPDYRATGETGEISLPTGSVNANGGEYDSGEIYFPERYCDGETNGLKVTFQGKVGSKTNDYEVFIGKGKEDDLSVIEDYNIYRNTHYTTTATINRWGVPPTLDYMVVDWEDEAVWELDGGQPSTSFTYYDNGTNKSTNVWYSADHQEGSVSFRFQMNSDTQWNVSQDNSANFTMEVYEIVDGVLTQLAENVVKMRGDFVIKVYPNENLSSDFPSCNVSMTYHNLTGEYANLLIDGGLSFGEDPYKITIKQVAIPETETPAP